MSAREVVVVDYGMGNVLSVCRGIEQCGGVARLSSDPNDVARAERLVLPGVGAFGDCVAALSSRDLMDPIRAFVANGRPFLGICVGMQILLEVGEEFEGAAGLGLIPGRVVQIATEKADGGARKIPHIGWAPIRQPDSDTQRWSGTIFQDTPRGTAFYLVHSFSARTANRSDCLAIVDYQGAEVTAAVRRDNVTGTQFHPEKSGPAGLQLLKGFLAV